MTSDHAMMWLLEDDRIRSAITKMWSDFVNNVDPKGYIMDVLIQHRVVSEDTAEKLCKKETRQDRSVSMLNRLLKDGNPQAFVVLRTALQEEYRYMVDKIDESTSGASSFLQCFSPTHVTILRYFCDKNIHVLWEYNTTPYRKTRNSARLGRRSVSVEIFWRLKMWDMKMWHNPICRDGKCETWIYGTKRQRWKNARHGKCEKHWICEAESA